jgi:tRNA A37 N6-isopentenylltransferase MiaA
MNYTLNPPLIIFIIGTTASGKTKLSIEIAKKYGGEIIRFLFNLSSDSM